MTEHWLPTWDKRARFSHITDDVDLSDWDEPEYGHAKTVVLESINDKVVAAHILYNGRAKIRVLNPRAWNYPSSVPLTDGAGSGYYHGRVPIETMSESALRLWAQRTAAQFGDQGGSGVRFGPNGEMVGFSRDSSGHVVLDRASGKQEVYSYESGGSDWPLLLAGSGAALIIGTKICELIINIR